MNYNDENLLEMVELYAQECGYIASEAELSARFDDEILPHILEQHGKTGVAFDDKIMVRETYNNWTDLLCKSNEIHPEQYNEYCYVGVLS